MTTQTRFPNHPINNASGKAVGILIALVLVLVLAGGGGYLAYNKYYRKAPLRSKLSSIKVKGELIRFTHDHVSTSLYRNMVLLDDVLVMMDTELDRLKRIGKKFPNQRGIVASQSEELRSARQRLAGVLANVNDALEKMYVTWLVNRSQGAGQIRSQKGTLTRQLADAIRGEAVLIGRVRTNFDTAS
jgi:intein-encoded DNA endonuclease-like protein